MKVLLTGGFGTVGLTILDLFLAEGHEVTVFEVPSKKNLRKAHTYTSRARVAFGDIRNMGDVEKAVAGQNVIVHCAAIVPPLSNENKKLCMDINVGGTRNIVDAIKKSANPAPLVYISSASVMGPTQNREPPVHASDPVSPVDAYGQSKAEAEKVVQESSLRFCILRLGAVMIGNLFNNMNQMKLAFDIPLQARCEVVHENDVGTACLHAAELIVKGGAIDGSVFFIGGGKQNGCQVTALRMYEGIFSPLGIRIPDASLFNSNLNSYYLDWYDTDQAQRLLDFQNHTFANYGAILRKTYRFLIPVIRLFGPFVNMYFRSQSPYKKQ